MYIITPRNNKTVKCKYIYLHMRIIKNSFDCFDVTYSNTFLNVYFLSDVLSQYYFNSSESKLPSYKNGNICLSLFVLKTFQTNTLLEHTAHICNTRHRLRSFNLQKRQTTDTYKMQLILKTKPECLFMCVSVNFTYSGLKHIFMLTVHLFYSIYSCRTATLYN